MTWVHSHDDTARAIVERVRPRLPACPLWCVEPHDNLHLGVDLGVRTVTRFHRSDRTTFCGEGDETGDVYLELYERVTEDGVADPLYRPVVSVDYDGSSGFTADQAWSLARALVKAASDLERLT